MVIFTTKLFKALGTFVLLLAVAGCGSEADREASRATVKFKVIAAFEVDGKPVEFSNVLQNEYQLIGKSLLGNGARTKTWGEALVVDLGQRGRGYMMMAGPTGWRDLQFPSYPVVYPKSYGLHTSMGSLTLEHLQAFKAASGRVPFRDDISGTGPLLLPLFVAFEDETNPNSVYQINYEDLQKPFGDDIRFTGMFIEAVPAEMPITTGVVVEYLPWLVKKYDIGFDKKPAGDATPLDDRPLVWVFNYNWFYGSESR